MTEWQFDGKNTPESVYGWWCSNLLVRTVFKQYYSGFRNLKRSEIVTFRLSTKETFYSIYKSITNNALRNSSSMPKVYSKKCHYSMENSIELSKPTIHSQKGFLENIFRLCKRIDFHFINRSIILNFRKSWYWDMIWKLIHHFKNGLWELINKEIVIRMIKCLSISKIVINTVVCV